MIPFDSKLSLLLDEATWKAERGSRLWAVVKVIIESIIMQSRKDE